jgi:hypothetical protein
MSNSQTSTNTKEIAMTATTKTVNPFRNVRNTEVIEAQVTPDSLEQAEISAMLDKMAEFVDYSKLTPEQRAENLAKAMSVPAPDSRTGKVIDLKPGPKAGSYPRIVSNILANLSRSGFFAAHGEMTVDTTKAKSLRTSKPMHYKVVRVQLLANGFNMGELEISTRLLDNNDRNSRVVCLRRIMGENRYKYVEMPIYNEPMRPYIDAWLNLADTSGMSQGCSLLWQTVLSNPKHTSCTCFSKEYVKDGYKTQMQGGEMYKADLIKATMQMSEHMHNMKLHVRIFIDERDRLNITSRQDGQKKPVKSFRKNKSNVFYWTLPHLLAKQINSIRWNQLVTDNLSEPKPMTVKEMRAKVCGHLASNGIEFKSSAISENLYKTKGEFNTRCQVFCTKDSKVRFDCYLSGLTKGEKQRAKLILLETIRDKVVPFKFISTGDSRNLRVSSFEYGAVKDTMRMDLTDFQDECHVIFARIVELIRK